MTSQQTARRVTPSYRSKTGFVEPDQSVCDVDPSPLFESASGTQAGCGGATIARTSTASPIYSTSLEARPMVDTFNVRYVTNPRIAAGKGPPVLLPRRVELAGRGGLPDHSHPGSRISSLAGARITLCRSTIHKRKRRFEQTPEPTPSSRNKSSVVLWCKSTVNPFPLALRTSAWKWKAYSSLGRPTGHRSIPRQTTSHAVEGSSCPLLVDFESTNSLKATMSGYRMVWDCGPVEPLSPNRKRKVVPDRCAEASAMLKKGDLKVRLHGRNLRATSPSFTCARGAPDQGHGVVADQEQDDAVGDVLRHRSLR